MAKHIWRGHTYTTVFYVFALVSLSLHSRA
jgi:hypothetical protein